MIWNIAGVLVLAWVVGIVTSFTMGGLIHGLLLLAVALVLFAVLKARAAGKPPKAPERDPSRSTGSKAYRIGNLP